ncbi:hypothetical protein H696_01286 [Fonticula alba]|uniref:Uncharacterized protein n=1 Tax=Fonticula alba TaxID=691883 RepID=A0A058ZD63_FONAL|nr:hypothetical protein H696_01286 [Fonticula alba]KCV71876.1 hypothetical protein H696_01286 [Fonticula alba]|eukprot:XP_009493454.1 hypothetical protein H696_01286 [Fonticula alba]
MASVSLRSDIIAAAAVFLRDPRVEQAVAATPGKSPTHFLASRGLSPREIGVALRLSKAVPATADASLLAGCLTAVQEAVASAAAHNAQGSPPRTAFARLGRALRLAAAVGILLAAVEAASRHLLDRPLLLPIWSALCVRLGSALRQSRALLGWPCEDRPCPPSRDDHALEAPAAGGEDGPSPGREHQPGELPPSQASPSTPASDPHSTEANGPPGRFPITPLPGPLGLGGSGAAAAVALGPSAFSGGLQFLTQDPLASRSGGDTAATGTAASAATSLAASGGGSPFPYIPRVAGPTPVFAPSLRSSPSPPPPPPPPPALDSPTSPGPVEDPSFCAEEAAVLDDGDALPEGSSPLPEAAPTASELSA